MSQTQTTVKTSKPLQTKSAPSQGQLRRLGFIPDVTLFTYSKLAELYKVGKGYVPSNFASQVKSIEDLYGKHGAPLLSKAADNGKEVLLLVDGQVDKGIKQGYSVYEQASENPRVKDAGDKFHASKEAVSKRVQESISFAQDNGIKGYVQYGKNQASKLIENSLDFVQTVLVKSSNYAGKLSQDSIDQLKRAFGIAQKQSNAARETIVKQPLYKKAYDSSNNLIAQAQETVVYKEASKRIYPVVAPIADPAIEKLQPFYDSTVQYFKPVSAAA